MSTAPNSEERLDRPALEQLQRRKLARLLESVLADNAFYRGKLMAVRFDALRDPLEGLPFTTRGEIEADQREHPPYGTNLTYPLSRYVRLHQTSGSSSAAPLRWLDTPEDWEWFKQCWTIVLRHAGVTAGDRVLFPFSFGPFIGFWAAFEAAASLGCLCLPAGGMTSAARLQFLIDNRATVVCCTPTYAQHLAEIAQAEGINLKASAVRTLIVAGEPGGSIPAVRARIEYAWGARVFDHAGMTEIGAWGYEPPERSGGLLVIESEFIAEVINPANGRPTTDDESGELVLTNLGRVGSPLIRYRTGDRVRLVRDENIGGRSLAWADGGVLGRVDEMLVIRGNNVFPAAIEGILRELPEIAEFRLRVRRQPRGLNDLEIEVEPAPNANIIALAERVEHAVRDRLHFRPAVSLAAPGALPRFELKARRVLWE
jgi:phenylacetate-CoA ligase